MYPAHHAPVHHCRARRFGVIELGMRHALARKGLCSTASWLKHALGQVVTGLQAFGVSFSIGFVFWLAKICGECACKSAAELSDFFTLSRPPGTPWIETVALVLGFSSMHGRAMASSIAAASGLPGPSARCWRAAGFSPGVEPRSTVCFCPRFRDRTTSRRDPRDYEAYLRRRLDSGSAAAPGAADAHYSVFRSGLGALFTP